jgi:hypothetical protein
MSKRIKLSKELYNLVVVEQTVAAYSGICRVSVSQEDKYICCDVIESVADIDLTIKEFENYMIGLTRKNDY